MDLNALFEQAKVLQEKAAAMQDALDRIEVEGSAGGGLVKLVMTARGALKRVHIDPTLFKPEEQQIVEDLIVAAHSDAKAKAERRLTEEMQSLSGGLSMPPGFKFPGL